MQAFNFTDDDIKIREVTINLGSKGTYTLREATEDAACKYRNSAMDKTQLKDGKVTSVSNLADTEPLLVGACLFDPSGKAVGTEFVRTLPARIVKKMFDWVQENSDMKAKEEDDDKGKDSRNDMKDS